MNFRDIMKELRSSMGVANPFSGREDLKAPSLQFLKDISERRVPTFFPFSGDGQSFDIHSNIQFACRDFCIKRGMWAVVTTRWTNPLAKWIGSRYVLEIMAGSGILSKAIAREGCVVVATDDSSFNAQHKKMRNAHPVFANEASDAVAKYGQSSDILLVSWPPYKDDKISDALDLWGTRKPILYIGEGEGGCTGSDTFHEFFQEDDNKWSPRIRVPQWTGLHDYLTVGLWTREIKAVREQQKVGADGRLTRKLDL